MWFMAIPVPLHRLVVRCGCCPYRIDAAQSHLEYRTPTGIGNIVRGNCAAESFEHAAADRKSQSRSLPGVFRGVERIKDLIRGMRIESLTLVRDGDSHMRGITLQRSCARRMTTSSPWALRSMGCNASRCARARSISPPCCFPVYEGPHLGILRPLLDHQGYPGVGELFLLSLLVFPKTDLILPDKSANFFIIKLPAIVVII